MSPDDELHGEPTSDSPTEGHAASQEPIRIELDPDDPKTGLQLRIRNALTALPGYFSFDNPISGINATDLFNLNTLLGAGIEVEVVRTLNRLREIWDPTNEWVGYRFERSSQAFPDVRLVRRDFDSFDIALGIELKGWFLLAKEGMPSLRYQVTPAACAPHDLICVVPWYLSNAVSGTAQTVEPWIDSARYAAEWRDYYWEHIRETKLDARIDHPANALPYPNKADLVLAKPRADGGGNFGRLPRARPLMAEFIARTHRHEVLGIPIIDWATFLKEHTDGSDPDTVTAKLQHNLETRNARIAPDAAEDILELLGRIARLTQ